MNYDAKKLPLGNIGFLYHQVEILTSQIYQENSRSQPFLVDSPPWRYVLKSHSDLSYWRIVKTLAEVIEKPNGTTAKQYGGLKAACEELSGAYYS